MKRVISLVLSFMLIISSVVVISPVDKVEAGITTSVTIDWNKFGSKYYYNKLSADKKAFWDEMDRICYSYLTTELDTTMTQKVTYDGKSYTYHTMPAIECKLSAQDMVDVWMLFTGANPQYYFLSTYPPLLDTAKQQAALDVVYKWSTGAKRKIATSSFAKQLAAWILDLQGNSDMQDPYSWETNLYYLIVDEVEYITGCADSQSAYSAVVNHKAVCAGLSKAYEMLANYSGLYNTITVTSANHEWNLIQLAKDNEKTWQVVDLTIPETNHAYGYTVGCGLNTDYRRIKICLEKDSDPDHDPEARYKGLLPTLQESKVDCAHNIKMGIYATYASGKVTLKGSNVGTIYYTTDGTKPSTKSAKYTEPISVAAGKVVRAFYKYTYGFTSREMYYVVGATAKQPTVTYYNIAFKANGGTGTTTDMIYTPRGRYVNLVSNHFTRSGYTFTGWNTKADGSGKAYGDKAKVLSLGTSGSTVTLYAQWKKNSSPKPDPKPDDPKPDDPNPITKKAQTITVSKKASKTVTYKVKVLKKKSASFNISAKAIGKITYKIKSYPKKGKKYIAVNSKGKVTLKKKAPKGTYKIQVTAAETSKYLKAQKVITVKIK